MTTIPRRANVTLIRQELMEKYGYTREAADDVLFYTADHWRTNGHKASEWKVPDSEGFITVRYHELSRFTVEDNREISPKPLDARRRTGYNRGSKGLPDHPSQDKRRDKHMPPAARGRRSATRSAPEPEPEVESPNGEVDFQKYIDKNFSPTMTDFITWFEDNVASLDDLPVDKILILGIQTYGHFQKSEFNVSRREARRSARAATREPEPEPEPEPVKPARGRPRGRAAAAPEPEPEPAPARRGRGRAAARAGAEAPY